MRQTPNRDDMTNDIDETDAIEIEDARQDPQDGALNAGQRRQGSDDAMRRERNATNPENAGQRSEQRAEQSGSGRAKTNSGKRRGQSA